jgi:hypothetical protein
MLFTLPTHRRSPSVAGTVPTRSIAATTEAEERVAVKPALVLTPTVETSEVKRTARLPPVDVIAGGTSAPPEKLPPEKPANSGALGDAPSYSLT